MIVRVTNKNVLHDFKNFNYYSDKIETVVSNILECFKTLFPEFNVIKPIIFLDDSMPKKTYGSWSCIKTAEEIKKRCYFSRRYSINNSVFSECVNYIEKIVDETKLLPESGINSQEDRLRGCLEELRGMVIRVLENEEEYSQEDLAAAKELTEVLSKLKIEVDVLGKYFPSSKKISIYYKNILPYENIEEHSHWLDDMTFTLAHEVFHYCHHQLSRGTYLESRKHATILKEASAEFFAFLYCVMSDNKELLYKAKSAYYGWKKYFYSESPYAKALYYFRLKGKEHLNWAKDDCNLKDLEVYGSIDKLKEVVYLSKTDMYKAYKALVYDKDIIGRNRDIEDGDFGNANPIVKFEIVHLPGTFGYNIPPVGYNVSLKANSVKEIHYSKRGDFYRRKVDYCVEMQPERDLLIDFFNAVNSLDWDKDYRAHVLDAGSWEAKLTRDDGFSFIACGNIYYPDGGEYLTELMKEIYVSRSYSGNPHIF